MTKKFCGSREQTVPSEAWHETLLRRAEGLADRSGLTFWAERTGDANLCLIMEGPLFVAAGPATQSAFQQLLVHAQQFDVMTNGDMVRMTFHYDLYESKVL